MANDFDQDFVMDEIDINSMADSSSVSDFNESESDISKGELLSTHYDLDKSDTIENHDWLQPFENEQVLSRSDRKTTYNRRVVKATE